MCRFYANWLHKQELLIMFNVDCDEMEFNLPLYDLVAELVQRIKGLLYFWWKIAQ